MLTKDLKTIIELMELSGKMFPVIKLEGFKAYATNGVAIVVRDVEVKDSGYISKDELPYLKGLFAKYKKQEFIGESIASLLTESMEGFPSKEIIQDAFDQSFEFNIKFDADTLIKVIKSLKGKDNKILVKINGDNKPFLIIHDNGKGLLQPIVS